jgi:hypothetical protein
MFLTHIMRIILFFHCSYYFHGHPSISWRVNVLSHLIWPIRWCLALGDSVVPLLLVLLSHASGVPCQVSHLSHRQTRPDDHVDLDLPSPDRRFLCDVYDVGCPAGIKEKQPQRGSNSGCQCSFIMTCYKYNQYSCSKVRVLQSITSNIQRGNFLCGAD